MIIFKHLLPSKIIDQVKLIMSPLFFKTQLYLRVNFAKTDIVNILITA